MLFVSHDDLIIHLKQAHPKALGHLPNFTKEHATYFEREIKRLAMEIFIFRYGSNAPVNNRRVENYKKSMRARIANGDPVPGYTPYNSI